MWTPIRPTEMGGGSNSVGFMVSEDSLHRTCFPVDCQIPLTLGRVCKDQLEGYSSRYDCSEPR